MLPLARVGDIQAELATQLEHLAQQAEVAAKYTDLQAQLALNELFPHLRQASDAALRDIFVSLRVPARPAAASCAAA